MYINLNGELIQVGIARHKDKLSLSLNGAEDIVQVYSAFAPERMPEVTIYEDSGAVSAIYANHRVTAVHWRGETIQVDLQVDPLEVTEAQRLSDAVSQAAEGAEVTDGALAEIAEMVADLESRVEALETPEAEGGAE